ncbi:MAG: glycosyltransferase [Alphaproteobacteria bacterium]
MKTISITTPCFNEEANHARDCYDAVKALFDDGPLAGYAREHVFADNCSADRTVEILREIACADPGRQGHRQSPATLGRCRSTYNAVLSARATPSCCSCR